MFLTLAFFFPQLVNEFKRLWLKFLHLSVSIRFPHLWNFSFNIFLITQTPSSALLLVFEEWRSKSTSVLTSPTIMALKATPVCSGYLYIHNTHCVIHTWGGFMPGCLVQYINQSWHILESSLWQYCRISTLDLISLPLTHKPASLVFGLSASDGLCLIRTRSHDLVMMAIFFCVPQQP